MKNFSDFLINANATIKEAMFKISKNSKGVVYVKNSKEQIVASITDGDIRRYLLNNGKIIDKVTSCFNKNYKFIKNSNISERDQILKLLDQKYKLIPVLNESKKLVDLIDNNYKAIIDKTVIVRSRSPARISLAGGGTDVTKIFFEQGATGISFTINKYCNVHLIRRRDQKIVIYSRDFNKKIIYENINFLNYNGKLDLIKASIKLLNPDFGFEIYIETDIKPGSGLGGSAAVSSAVIGAINYLQRRKLTKYEIAELAFQAERIELGILGGWQDQYSTVFGGCNLIEFSKNLNLVQNLTLPNNIIDELERRMVLVNTNLPHKGEAIHKKKKSNRKIHNYVSRIKELVSKIKSQLIRGKTNELGFLIQQTWELKKSLDKKMTNKKINYLESKLCSPNLASGCRLLGTGGGGYMLFFIDPKNWFNFLNVIKKYKIEHSFIKFDNEGIKVWESDV